MWKPIVPTVETLHPPQRPPTRVIGVHMRTSDKFAWETASPFALEDIANLTKMTLLQCAQVRLCALLGCHASTL